MKTQNIFIGWQKQCFVILIATASLFTISCKKLVEVDSPITQLDGAAAYKSNSSAASVLTGLYNQMGPRFTGIIGISAVVGASSDEFLLAFPGTSQTIITQAYKNALLSTNEPFWRKLFQTLYAANAAIEGVSASSSLSPAVKQQLLGEAKFVRAFCYFYLVNLYGDVPLILTTEYQNNATLARESQTRVWQQIIQDLKEAKDLLNTSYVEADAVTVKTSTERVRPTSWAAAALLARAYLYQNKNDSAEIMSTAILANKTVYDTVPLLNVFFKNTKETIWQLPPVDQGINAYDAGPFLFTSGTATSAQPLSVSTFLYNSFEATDQRRGMWTKATTSGPAFNYITKYKQATTNTAVTATEYNMVLRVGEQFLIRAEARAQQGNLSGALDDLNVIRKRAGLGNFSTTDKAVLLTTIQHERQVELFSEWGHRWFDLKRTSQLNTAMTAAATAKGTTWSMNWAVYPVPQYDITTDPNLSQNNGYQ